MVRGADLAVLITKWKSFASLSPAEFKSLMKEPVLFDGRRMYDKTSYSSGMRYAGVGLKGQ